MTIWLVYPYTTLPQEQWREYRCHYLAQSLNEKGHHVVLWTANFWHRNKTFRTQNHEVRTENPLFTVHLLPSLPYYKNISWQRIRFEQHFAQQFLLYSKTLVPPDVLVLREPAPFYSKPILDYTQQHNCVLMVDILDIYPELFAMVLPKYLRFLHKIIFQSLYQRRKKLIQNANAIVGVCNQYTQIGQAINPNIAAQTVYSSVKNKSIEAILTPTKSLDKLDITPLKTKPKDQIWAIYAGSLGKNYDMMSILDLALNLKQRQPNLVFILAGMGEMEIEIKQKIKKNQLTNVIFIGFLDENTLTHLLSYCDIGLMTYAKQSTVSLPVKFFEYVALGLPMLNSLESTDAEQLIGQFGVGLTYKSGDLNDFEAKMMQLIDNETLCLEMKKNCRKLSEWLDADKQYAVYADFIEKNGTKTKNIEKK